MWIEPYKAGGRKYYRAREGEERIHLGSAEAIVRKVRPDFLAKRTKKAENPRTFQKEMKPNPPKPLFHLNRQAF